MSVTIFIRFFIPFSSNVSFVIFSSNLFITYYLNKFDSLFKTIYVLDIDNVNQDDMVGLNEGLNIN